MVQWLGLGTFTAMVPGSIPGRGTTIHKLHGAAKKKKNFFFSVQKYTIKLTEGHKRRHEYMEGHIIVLV